MASVNAPARKSGMSGGYSRISAINRITGVTQRRAQVAARSAIGGTAAARASRLRTIASRKSMGGSGG